MSNVMSLQSQSLLAHNVVDTHNFWSLMCHPRFVRLSTHYGAVDGRIVFCMRPPELVPGYIEERYEHVCWLLREARPTRVSWWQRIFNRGEP